MPWNARILNSGPGAFCSEHVTVAHATGLHLDPNLPFTRLRHLPLNNLEACSCFRNLRRLHLRYCNWRYSSGCHKYSCGDLVMLGPSSTAGEVTDNRSRRASSLLAFSTAQMSPIIKRLSR